MTNIILPDNISSINEDEAFANNTGLKTVTFNKGLKKLDDGCFVECSKLKELSLDPSAKLGQDIVSKNVKIIRKKINSTK